LNTRIRLYLMDEITDSRIAFGKVQVTFVTFFVAVIAPAMG